MRLIRLLDDHFGVAHGPIEIAAQPMGARKAAERQRSRREHILARIDPSHAGQVTQRLLKMLLRQELVAENIVGRPKQAIGDGRVTPISGLPRDGLSPKPEIVEAGQVGEVVEIHREAAQ